MIYLAADHRGFNLKEKIKEYLTQKGLEFDDLGNVSYDENDDYSDYAIKVGERVTIDPTTKGILICGSGVGICVAANKVAGIRCGLGFNVEQVQRARQEDNINCLALPADFLEEEKVFDLVQVFLNTLFDNGENHLRRIKKITSYETS